MRKFFAAAFLLFFAVAAFAQNVKTATISGLIKSKAKVVHLTILNPDNLFEMETRKANIDDQGRFSFSLSLSKPTYFYLNGMDIYLRPGDDLSISSDNTGRIAFSGKAAPACSYLKGNPMYKAGSFLKGGIAFDRKEVSADNLLHFVDSCLAVRSKELADICNDDPYFKSIELNRNQLNAANTIISFGFYEAMKLKLDRNEAQKRASDIVKRHHDVVASYLSCINRPENIVLGECTNLLNSCKEYGFYSSFCTELEEYIAVDEFLSMLKGGGVSSELVSDKDKLMASVKNVAYRKVVDDIMLKYKSLMPGAVAPDITFEMPDGKSKKFSDFKGKLLVVDVWATWCGPCRREKPVFAKIAKDLSDKPVVFLALSSDSNIDAWKKMVADHHEDVAYVNGRAQNLDGYNIEFIPRFIVISKDSKIINAFAPYPSSGDLEKLILKNI